MKQIVFIFMAILLATGMASAQKKAVISAETTSFDFGTIKEADGKVSHTFEVSNTGDIASGHYTCNRVLRMYDPGMAERTGSSG